MTTHRLPFENRWTNNANALQWNCELDHLGVANVRAMFVDHETRIPTGATSCRTFRPASSGTGWRSRIGVRRGNNYFGAQP
jgi:hypothetical protein